MPPSDPLVGLLHEWTGQLVGRSIRSLIIYMKENDLSISQVGALFQVHHGRANVSNLGEGLGITTAAASQMLDRLVQQDLIRRSEDPDDRRAKKLMLTGKGCRLVQQSLQTRQNWLAEVVEALSAREREQVAAAVKILIEKTEGLDEQPAAVR